jgi:hypothetical protein
MDRSVSVIALVGNAEIQHCLPPHLTVRFLVNEFFAFGRTVKVQAVFSFIITMATNKPSNG